MSIPSQVPDAGTPIFDANGYINPVWHQFFFSLLRRTGGTEGVDLSDQAKRIKAVENRVTDAELVEYSEAFDQLATVESFDQSVVFDHGVQYDSSLHALVTTSNDGFMSAADKSKLDGVTPGAAVSSVSGTSPISSTGGTTPVISISAATSGAAGSMSAADKTKLDALPLRLTPVTLTADVTAANSTADFNILSLSIPANSLVSGSFLSAKLASFLGAAASGGIFSVWVKVGATKLISLNLTAPASATSFIALRGEILMTIRPGSIMFIAGSLTTINNTFTPVNLTQFQSASFDPTIANTLTIGVNWGTALAANTATVNTCIISQEK